MTFFATLLAGLLVVAIFAIMLSRFVDARQMPLPTNTPTQQTILRTGAGEIKYGEGTCSTDNNCTPAGCSREVCSFDPDLVTTCEVKADMPDTNVFSCGCFEGYCAWIKTN